MSSPGQQREQRAPSGYEILYRYADDVRDYPVERQATWELQGKERDHQRHHPEHHRLVGLLPRVGRRGHGHLLLDPRRYEHQRRNDDGQWVWLAEVQPEELRIQRGGRVDVDHWYPAIQLVGKPHKVVGLGEHCLDQHPEQPDQDGHLHNQRAQAADGVDTSFPVHAHGFLRHSRPVVAVALLEFLHPRLESTHGPHLADLLECQRESNYTDQGGEQDDGDAHLAETDDVQHHQRVEHRPDDCFVPDYREGFQKVLLPGRFALDVAVPRVQAPMSADGRLPSLVGPDLDSGHSAVL